RRAMIRGLGVVGAAAVAAPVISTLKVPAAAVSGSCVGGGEFCSTEAHSKIQCCQGFVCCDNSDGTKTCSNTGTGCTPVVPAAPPDVVVTGEARPPWMGGWERLRRVRHPCGHTYERPVDPPARRRTHALWAARREETVRRLPLFAESRRAFAPERGAKLQRAV